MIQTGLVSVTFRQLDCAAIVRIATDARLDGIEWGGDVHVPHGDLPRAREVAAMTRDAGLTVFSYGSYYRAGAAADQTPDFARVLETAVALGAPRVRVWAGTQGSAAHDADARRRVVEDLARICDLAGPHTIDVCVEHHDGTLTDTTASALALGDEVGRTSFRHVWQPSHRLAPAERSAELERMLPRVSHVHVFHWTRPADQLLRCPLAVGASDWQGYLERLAAVPRAIPALLEFVEGDDPHNLMRDAATLHAWIESTLRLRGA